MKRLVSFALALLVAWACVCPAAAAGGRVIYWQEAEKFFFQPGTQYSPTDLFRAFKDVMPGDTIEQQITVRNDVSNNCKIKIYLRSLGAQEGSEAFLSQLRLRVTKDTDTVMFDAPADESAQLGDWVYLGTLYSGGECQLTVTLEVPVTLDDRFQNAVGHLEWEFAAEELPVEPTDPEAPETGDNSHIRLWAFAAAGAALAMVCMVVFARKRREND